MLLLFLQKRCARYHIAVVRHIHSTVVLDHSICLMHPVSQGNLLRGGVGVPNDGANLICPKGFKGVLPARLRRFGGIAAVPVGAVEEVPNFQKLLTLPRLHGQAALTNHFAGLFEDDRPKTKAELTVSLQLAVQPYLRFAVTEGNLRRRTSSVCPEGYSTGQENPPGSSPAGAGVRFAKSWENLRFIKKFGIAILAEEKERTLIIGGKALCEKIAAHELLQSKIYLLRFGEGWSVWIG